jgi:hypothetical protein
MSSVLFETGTGRAPADITTNFPAALKWTTTVTCCVYMQVTTLSGNPNPYL